MNLPDPVDYFSAMITEYRPARWFAAAILAALTFFLAPDGSAAMTPPEDRVPPTSGPSPYTQERLEMFWRSEMMCYIYAVLLPEARDFFLTAALDYRAAQEEIINHWNSFKPFSYEYYTWIP